MDITVELHHILENIKKYIAEPNLQLIEDAYNFAVEQHGDQKRLSGEPYIIHPANVAYILTTLEVDEITIASALLHDLIEDANVSTLQITKKVGQDVSYLVDDVTKLGKIHFSSQEEHRVENF